MATEGLKKKDLQRTVQKVHMGATISSDIISSSNTTERVELGFPAEKISVVSTGDLIANVMPKIAHIDANASSVVSNSTPANLTAQHMFTAVEITWTSGTGKVIIIAK